MMTSVVLVLDRIEPGVTPPYCTHGRATCVGGCGEWVWLGDRTFEMVKSGEAAPLCWQCATALVPQSPDARRVGTVYDRLRSQGPH